MNIYLFHCHFCVSDIFLLLQHNIKAYNLEYENSQLNAHFLTGTMIFTQPFFDSLYNNNINSSDAVN